MPVKNLYADHVEHMVQGYAAMVVDIPVTREFVWEKINEMAARDPDLWGELPELVAARVKELKHAGNRR